MKNKLMLALSGILLVLVGCNESDDLLSKNQVSKRFSVELNSELNTRGNVDLRMAQDPPSRCIMEVYEGSTATGNPILRIEQSGRVFENVILNDKQTYTVLFWADLGTPTATGETPAETNEYDASDLKSVRVVTGKQATRPAYAGCGKFTIGKDDESVYTQLVLSHAVAKVQYKQSEALTSASNVLVVTYPKSFSLNVDGMGTTEIAGELSHNFTYNVSSSGTLGTDYLIAASGATSTVMDITTELTSGGLKTSKQLTSVPFKCNFQTNLNGAYSDLYNSVLTVTCTDQWDSADNLVEFPKPKLGDYYYSDNTYSTVRNTSKTPIGIIYYLDASDPKKGRIVSLDEGYAKWSTVSVVTGAEEGNFGLVNMTTLKAFTSGDLTSYPAFYWCDAKNTPAITGIQWYLPAFDDLQLLFNWWETDPVAINAIITNCGVAGADVLKADALYWSSYECSNSTAANYQASSNNAWVVPKSTSQQVRAVSYFTAL